MTNGFVYRAEGSGVPDDGESPAPSLGLRTASAMTTASDHRLPPLAMGILQACRFVGLGKTKMQELINRGDVATAKVDGRTLVLTDSVVALVERSRVARGQ